MNKLKNRSFLYLKITEWLEFIKHVLWSENIHNIYNFKHFAILNEIYDMRDCNIIYYQRKAAFSLHISKLLSKYKRWNQKTEKIFKKIKIFLLFVFIALWVN